MGTTGYAGASSGNVRLYGQRLRRVVAAYTRHEFWSTEAMGA